MFSSSSCNILLGRLVKIGCHFFCLRVVCGDLHTACLTDRGILMTFGSGSNGCLGHGTFQDIERVSASNQLYFCPVAGNCAVVNRNTKQQTLLRPALRLPERFSCSRCNEAAKCYFLLLDWRFYGVVFLLSG